MSPVYHRMVHLSVNRRSDDELTAECSLLSSDCEAVGRLYTDVQNLSIRKAAWACFRSPDINPGYYEIPEMHGIQAYLQAGPHLKRILGSKDQEMARILLSECVRGIIQAETYFFRERGFPSAVAYDRFWDTLYAGGCRYYSHLDRVEKAWMDYVGEDERCHNLFNRYHTVSITREQENNHRVMAAFVDSFHELTVHLYLNKDGAVEYARADYSRAPDKICWENAERIANLMGKSLKGMRKPELATAVGGPDGCTHLVDILYDACQALSRVL